MAPVTTLKKRAEFLKVKNKGVSAVSNAFIMQLLKTSDGKTRIGYTVSKKVGDSVERNRIKRRYRAAAAKAFSAGGPGKDIVLIGRTAALTIPFARLVNDLEKTLKKLGS